MKKWLKITLIVVSSLAALIIIISLIISPIAHWYIEKNSKEICGRTLTMDDLTINIFKGTVDIEKFVALEQNDKDKFVTFNRLKVNVSLWKLLSKQLQFTEITLDTPDVIVIQNGDRFNFTDIIEHFSSDEEDDEEESTWTFDLQNITLINGTVTYRDVVVNSRFSMKELALAIPQIYFSNEKTDVGVNLKFADGGDLSLKLLYAVETSSYNLHVQMNRFSLADIAPYLKQYLNINTFDGKLTTDLTINGEIEHILDITAKGNVMLTNLSATSNDNKKLASIQNLEIAIDSINVPKNIFHFSKIEATKLDVTYEQFSNGKNTFSDLFLPDETSTSSSVDSAENKKDTVIPFDFCIENFAVTQSQITYKDFSMREPVAIPVLQIDLRINRFTFDKATDIKLKAVVGESGQLDAHWNMNLSNFSNQELNVFLRNFKMKDVSPYCVHYLAYPISDGILSFASSNKLTNNYINSSNKIDIFNCTVEKKLKNVTSEYKIPLRAAIYILTDRKGKISMDLPVTGDINSPSFSYRKIIFKTFCNLIIKVAAAPFDFIINSIGGEPGTFDDIQYSIRPQGLGSESYDRLNKVADAMKAKPELILTLQQSLDKEENMQEYALFNAKKSFYMAQNHKQTLEMSDYDQIGNIKNNNSDFAAYVEGQLKDSTSHATLAEKCLSLYEPAFLEQQINVNLERRNTMIINQFTTQGIPRNRLEILPVGDKKTPKGKTLLSFGIKVNE